MNTKLTALLLCLTLTGVSWSQKQVPPALPITSPESTITTYTSRYQKNILDTELPQLQKEMVDALATIGADMVKAYKKAKDKLAFVKDYENRQDDYEKSLLTIKKSITLTQLLTAIFTKYESDLATLLHSGTFKPKAMDELTTKAQASLKQTAENPESALYKKEISNFAGAFLNLGTTQDTGTLRDELKNALTFIIARMQNIAMDSWVLYSTMSPQQRADVGQTQAQQVLDADNWIATYKKNMPSYSRKDLITQKSQYITNLFYRAFAINLVNIINETDANKVKARIKTDFGNLYKELVQEIDAESAVSIAHSIEKTAITAFANAYATISSDETRLAAKKELARAITTMQDYAEAQLKNKKAEQTDANKRAEIGKETTQKIADNIKAIEAGFVAKKITAVEYVTRIFENNAELAYAAGLIKNDAQAISAKLKELHDLFTSKIDAPKTTSITTDIEKPLPPPADTSAQKLLIKLAYALAEIAGTPVEKTSSEGTVPEPKTSDTGAKKTFGTLVYETIVAGSATLEKPKVAKLKTDLLAAIKALKADKDALADIRTYPKKLSAELAALGTEPSATEVGQFWLVAQILQVIDKTDNTIFTKNDKTDLDTLIQKIQATGKIEKEPGVMKKTLNWVKSWF